MALILDNFSGTSNTDYSIGSGFFKSASQSFAISMPASLSIVNLNAYKTGSPAGSFNLSIYTAVSGSGGVLTPGTQLYVASFSASLLSSSVGSSTKLTLPTPQALSTGNYFLQIDYTGDSNNYISWRNQTPGDSSKYSYVTNTSNSVTTLSGDFNYSLEGNYTSTFPTPSIVGGWGVSVLGMQSPGEISRPLTVVTTRDQSGKFKVYVNTTRTQTGKFRVQGILTRTQTGKFRTQATTTRTQSGLFRVALTSVKDQFGMFRVASEPTFPQPGQFRVQAAVDRSQSGTFNVVTITTKTQTGQFRVSKLTTQTQSGKFNAYANYAKDQSGKFWVYKLNTQNQSGQFRVAAVLDKTQSGKFAVIALTLQDQAGRFATYNPVITAGNYYDTRQSLGTFETFDVDTGLSYAQTNINKGTY